MSDLNDIDTEGIDRMDAVANLIHDHVGIGTLFKDRGVPSARFDNARVIDSETVKLYFTDGRTITVRLEITPALRDEDDFTHTQRFE